MKSLKFGMILSLFMLFFNYSFAQIEWIPFQGEIPDQIVMGGVENHVELPVCRGNYRGAYHPGKVVANKCNIGYGGLEIVLEDFEVLINKGGVALDWEKSNGTLPEHAIQGGNENGTALYVGRAFHNNSTHPGKIFSVGNNYICNIGYGGKEYTLNSFDVLVEHPLNEAPHILEHNEACEDPDNPYFIKVEMMGSIGMERQIDEGFSLASPSLKYQTRVTDDGRLVVERIHDIALCNSGQILVLNAEEIWANTPEHGDSSLDYFLKFQEDGNLCIYSKQNGFVWCSMSHNRDGHHFEITNKGHIEVVNNYGVEIWPD